MNRLALLARRWLRARRHGVRFRGMSHTTLPDRIVFGGEPRALRFPDHALQLPDFVNVVLDDDYGVGKVRGPVRSVVDIGANVGLFTLLARERFPAARIHAYEPSPGTAAYARVNIAHPLTTLFEEGVAAEDGRAEMVELGGATLAQTAQTPDGAIALTSFARVLERAGGRIDLLKVDCEGAEWDFLRDRDLFRRVGTIRMEYHLTAGRTLADLYALAEGIDFAVTRLVENQGFGIAWLDPVERGSTISAPQ